MAANKGMMILVLALFCLFQLGFGMKYLAPHVPRQIPVQGEVGEPLFLTPYIKNNDLETAKNLAKVVDPLPDIGTAIADQYSGFITVNNNTNSNMFFWFFPATEVDPATAPVVMWLQGGPGSSSMFGLLEIHGPISAVFDENQNTIGTLNPHTWTRKANMLYVDNPVGSGYSFANPEGLPQFQDDVARDLYEFLIQWFTLFSEYQSNPFFPFGESYAGKFVPTIGVKIDQENPTADLVINLAGVGIGDGFMSPPDTAVHADFLYQLAVVDEVQRDALKVTEDEIKLAAANEDWTRAEFLWRREQIQYQTFTGCPYVYEARMCEYDPEEDNYEVYMQYDTTRRAIHVGDRPFGSQGGDVFASMREDFMQYGQANVEYLLDRYPVLIYDGNFDIICNHAGILNMFAKMETWSAIDEYRATGSIDYQFDGTTVGYLKAVQNLRMYVMRNAGHMVPRSQPEAALDMFEKFINGNL